MSKQDISVKQLVNKVSAGELTLPEMQRRYVWPAIKVRDLLDSLYRGYPSGTILVWETDNAVNDRKLAVSEARNSVFTAKFLLLDGQQRITSLTSILMGSPILVRGKAKPIEILFNLEHPNSIDDETLLDDPDTDDFDEDDDDDSDELDVLEELKKRTFVVASKSLKNDPHWISVTDIFKKSESQLLKPLNINSDDPLWDKYAERIRNVRKIEDYQYVMQILGKEMEYAEVTEIFVRVNSLGAKLRGSDLALAQITSRWKGFMKELEKFAKEFDNNEDYLHESGVLIKTLIAFATNQSKFKSVHKISLDKLQSSWIETQKGLRFAINFLKSNVKIENLGLISSSFLLIPIAYYAVLRNERLTEEEERKLLLWFYVAHMKGRYSYGSSESYLDSDLSAIKKNLLLDDLLFLLKTRFKEYFITSDDVRNKGRRSPFFSMLFFIAKQKEVKDWQTGIVVSEKLTGKAHALQFHHIFPKSLLKEASIDRKEINDISNLAFINGRTNRNISNKEPSKYLPEIAQKRGELALTSQYIPIDITKLAISNYSEFVEYRRGKIVEVINNHLTTLILK